MPVGDWLTIVLHPFMLGWLGAEHLAALLNRIASAAARGELWVAPCAEVAERVLADPGRFRGGTSLDAGSWTR
jgi:hypothetical protein